MTQVKIISENAETAVVEYNEGKLTRRVIIPNEFIKNGEVDKNTLAMGIPDSVDVSVLMWDYIKVELNNILLKKGLLTLSDIQVRPADFNSAILAAVGKPLIRLFQDKEGV